MDSESETLAILNAILRHHVRNHLTVIRGRAQWLGRDGGTADDVDAILKRCDEMAETVDRIGAVTNSLTGGAQTVAFDLEPFVRSELDDLQSLYDASLTLSVETNETAVIADDLFSFVLRELIANAVSHATSQSPDVEIVLSSDRDSVLVDVSTRDRQGVPDDLTTDPFAVSGSVGPEGPEYGLFLSQAIVGRYSGAVDIQEETDGAMRLRVRLPRA